MAQSERRALTEVQYLFFLGLIAIGSCACSTERDENIEFNKNILDAPLLDVIWCGDTKENDQNVIVLTEKGTLYKSSDRGFNFERKTEELHKQAINAAGDMDIEVGYVNKMQRNSVDANLILFLGSMGVHWISEDCGDNFRGITFIKNFKDFQFHPSERNWILASSWTNCVEEQKGKPCSLSRELYLTKDAAQTWTKLRSYVSQYSWGLKSNSTEAKFPQQRIIWSEEILNQGNQQVSGWNMNTHLFVSDDFLVSKLMVVNQGNRFLLTEEFLYVAQVFNVYEQIVKLMVSEANVLSFDFRYAELEEENLKLHSFTILDTSEGQAFININHHKPNSPMGEIYISDATGVRFSKSLRDNVRDKEGQCDFEKINGIKGIYISNVYAGQNARRFEEILQTEESDAIEVEATRGKNQKNTNQVTTRESFKQFLEALSKYKQSMITFDKGGMWKPLRPPTQDYRGNQIKCEINDNCSLHLNSHSSFSYGPIYSAENSVGIILATGNVGQYLETRLDQINTYLSRDAGFTWHQIRQGSHIYEIGDHGAIIVMASDQMATTQVLYSWDQGISWKELQISSEPVQISNIITEPDNTSQRFIVYGELEVEVGRTKVKQGLVVSIDFQNLHVRQCQGVSTPNSEDSDYEKWTPNGNISPDCLMGGKFTFVRRKRDACCYNGEDWDHLIDVEICQCTEENWECDLGFERKVDDGPCQAEQNYEVSYDPPEICDGYYFVTQGYRQIAGDYCEGGIDHSYIQLPCPMFSFFSSTTLYNFLLLFFGLGVLYFIFQNKDSIIYYLSQIADTRSPLQSQGQNSGRGSSNNDYMDFANIQVDRSEGAQFDSSLIEPSVPEESDKSNQITINPEKPKENPDLFDPRE